MGLVDFSFGSSFDNFGDLGDLYGATAPAPRRPSSVAALIAQLQGMTPPVQRSFADIDPERQRESRRLGMLTMAAALAGAPRGQLGSALAAGALRGHEFNAAAEDEDYRRQRQEYQDQYEGLSNRVRPAQ